MIDSRPISVEQILVKPSTLRIEEFVAESTSGIQKSPETCLVGYDEI